MTRSAFVALGLCFASLFAHAGDGNRLTYLDEFCDPYYPHKDFPKLTTPQWVGDKDVECVVVLAIDDMREPEKYETYLRPILDRLKQIDGRAPVSIMTCQADPKSERIQQWLKEGLSIDVHTFDHPCPCLAGGDFAKSKATYDKCVDLLNEIPGNKPVAFRMPCCDSLNTPSPRFWMEAFNKTTENGNFLTIDSSVFNIITGNDASLPREITHNEQGEERFRRYVPFKSFVNTIEDYPYPYVIGKLCWQFPCVVPSDWSAQHVQKPNNPDTVRDLKLALDACVIKQGVYNLVFHPHGWIRNDQIVELIDHAVSKHGKKVKFLNFRECDERLQKNLLAGQALRDSKGTDNGARILDANGDGYMDVVIGNQTLQRTRIWDSREKKWLEGTFPDKFDARGPRFGVLLGDGRASLVDTDARVWHLTGAEWIHDDRHGWGIPAKAINDDPMNGAYDDIGLRLRDIDNDGVCELIFGNRNVKSTPLHRWNGKARQWQSLPFALPKETSIVARGYDTGLRFVDLEGDGDDDIVHSNHSHFGVYLFESIERGWKLVFSSAQGIDSRLPPITRNAHGSDITKPYVAQNNGAFFHSKHLWWQNEDTNRLPDHVDRRSFAALLGKDDTNPTRERGASPQEKEKEPQKEAPKPAGEPTITPTDRKSAAGQEASDERIKAMGEPKSPQEALKTIVVKKGFKVELVAAEPLVVDPVAFDWGPDGRLWVVEMRDYPRGLDEKGKPGGRVKVLTDKDGDGKYDEAQLFLDDLPFPTGIKVWRKGCIVSAAPEVLYAEDTDGDGKADKRETLLKGFGEGNQQHRVNGLRWGMDGWLYLGNGDSGGKITSFKSKTEVEISGRDLRFRPDTGEIDPISGQTQFSLCFDDFGNRFGGNNSNPVWHYMLEDYHLRRNPHVKPPQVKHQISTEPGAAKVFPLSTTVTRFNDYQAANRFTSACGIEIYRDKYLGDEYYGNVFVCEPVHNLVHREILKPEGVSFTSHRARDEKESEFLASTDNWFRPVMVRTGPDGALYIADMYRLVIEHPTWIPEDWQKKLNLRAGDDKGRIYRVVRDDKRPPEKLKNLDELNTKQVAAELESSSGTRRDLVQQVLMWRDDPERAAPHLRMLTADRSPAIRTHALWALATTKEIQKRDLRFAKELTRHETQVMRNVVRIASLYFPDEQGLRHDLNLLAHAAKSADVDLEVALALGSLTHPFSVHFLAETATRNSSNPVIIAAVLTSLAEKEQFSAFVDRIAADAKTYEQLQGHLAEAAAGYGEPLITVKQWDQLADDKEWKSSIERMEKAAQLLAASRGVRNFTFKKSADAEVVVLKLLKQANEIVGDETQPLENRVAAAKLLFEQDVIRHLSSIPGYAFAKPLLRDDAPAELRTLARERLPTATSFPFDDLLHDQWVDRTQTQRRELLDLLIANQHAQATLLKLLDSQRLIPGDIDATRAQLLANHPNKNIQKKAAALTKVVTFSFSDRQKLVDQFADVLKLRGDVSRGRAAFRKRCTACHKQEGEGRQIGPDLASLTDKSGKSLLTAMLDPNRAVEAKFIEYLVITDGGQLLSGVVTSETGTSITLIGPDGKEHTILRSEIDVLHSNKKSLMPEGLERDLTKQELADVIAYLQATAVPPKTFEGNTPALVKADDDGTIELLAANARIYGPKIIYETKYKNLGWWQSADDSAEWSLEVPAAGKYRATLDYACEASAAGDTLQLAIGEQTVLFKVASTGTWDDYVQKAIGTIELTAGPAEASVRSSGAVRSALIDLRGIKLEPVK